MARLAADRSGSRQEKVVSRILTCAVTSHDSAWCASGEISVLLGLLSSSSSTAIED